MKKIAISVSALICILLLAGCGGGALLQDLNPAISPASATVSTGQQFQFQITSNGSTVTDIASLNLIWTVNGIVGGNSTFGTISNAGLYTAPTVIPNPSNVTINAGSNSVSAQITIIGNSGTGGGGGGGGGGGSTPSATITVSPNSIAPGQSAMLSWSSANVSSCTINNDSSINGTSIGLSGSAQVSPTATTTYEIDCTGSNGNASGSATLTVQVSNSGIGVTITPSTGTLASGQSMQFTAVISNDTSGQGVTWSATVGSAPAPSFASSLVATYVAPIVTANTTVQIKTTSIADPSAFATASITVTPDPSSGGSCKGAGAGSPFIAITPDSPVLPFGGSTLLTATIMASGVTDDSVTWQLQPGEGVTNPGTLTTESPTTVRYDATGISTFTTVRVVATSVQCPGVTGAQTIQVNNP